VGAADPTALLDAAEWLAAHPARGRDLGEAGRAFSAAQLSPAFAIDAFARIIKSHRAGDSAISREEEVVG